MLTIGRTSHFGNMQTVAREQATGSIWPMPVFDSPRGRSTHSDARVTFVEANTQPR